MLPVSTVLSSRRIDLKIWCFVESALLLGPFPSSFNSNIGIAARNSRLADGNVPRLELNNGEKLSLCSRKHGDGAPFWQLFSR
jgi:hypothetical protein